ncbi:MAG: ATP-binding cassette domain-containing protein [Comamonadaceae bacterium]|nr:ATP-binding cassette domain-containing protein [Comamonadaceae bacterium]
MLQTTGLTCHLEGFVVVTLLGRNGAGRSTTMRAILGLVGPHAGRIEVFGQGVMALPPHRIARLGVGWCPTFLMKVLCFARFASAFNLLLGYGGLLSFGHAAFFGSAAYVCGCPGIHAVGRALGRGRRHQGAGIPARVADRRALAPAGRGGADDAAGRHRHGARPAGRREEGLTGIAVPGVCHFPCFASGIVVTRRAVHR